MLDFILSIDKTLFLFFNSTIANPVFDAFFLFITNGRNWLYLGLIILGLYIWHQKKHAITGIILGGITFAITDAGCYRILKPLFGRPKPCHPQHLVEGGRFLLGYKPYLSFPSNHAANAFGLAMLFTLMYPKRWYWLMPVAALVAFSRVYVGVHYPLDIIAGAIVGAGAGAGVYYGWKYIDRKIRNWKLAIGKRKSADN
jgi:undecaprenyl-diphosphatase